MIDLLKKYPFLVYRNVFSGEKSHDTLDEDIEYIAKILLRYTDINCTEKERQEIIEQNS